MPVSRPRFRLEVLGSVNTGLARVGIKVVPRSVLGPIWTRYFLYFGALFDEIRDVRGDVVECGVGSGNSFGMLAAIAAAEGRDRRVVGFDSWEGLPEPAPIDLASPAARSRRGLFASSPRAVEARMRQYGLSLDDPRVVLVPGRFEQTLDGKDVTEIALLHIDVDLYESYRTVLESLWGRVRPGGIVAFDEYRDPPYPGATQAVDEFLSAERGSYELHKSSYIDRWYVVKRAPA